MGQYQCHISPQRKNTSLTFRKYFQTDFCRVQRHILSQVFLKVCFFPCPWLDTERRSNILMSLSLSLSLTMLSTPLECYLLVCEHCCTAIRLHCRTTMALARTLCIVAQYAQKPGRLDYCSKSLLFGLLCFLSILLPVPMNDFAVEFICL